MTPFLPQFILTHNPIDPTQTRTNPTFATSYA